MKFTLTKVECPICGVYFGLPTTMYETKKERGGVFYCPNGHCLTFNDNFLRVLLLELNKAREEISRLQADERNKT